jgi:TolB-like protein/Flp pilus assembly protein TadD
MPKNDSSVLASLPKPPGERLDSWKEIASYLKRETRTVRRWETHEGLPVHRHLHNVRGSIYAFRPELDSWWAGRRTRPRSGSIVLAVLPFENLSGDLKQQRISDGLTDEVTTRLANLSPACLGVIARRSAMRFRRSTGRIDKIAGKLGATHIVGGSIRSEGDHTVVTVQLVRASDQTHLWADSYRSDRTNTLAGQSEIARMIAESTLAKLVPVPKPAASQGLGHSAVAHRVYLKGRFFWNQRTAEELTKGIACFDQAILEDPTYAPAYAGLADSYIQLGFYGVLPAAPAMKKAKLAALKAVELDDTLGEAHTSLADVMTYFDWNLIGAEKEYQRAIQLNPTYATAHHWYGDYLAMMGRFDEAHVKGQRALELDPVSPIINIWVGMKYYFGGCYDEAVEQYRKTLEMHPNYVLAHWALGLAYEQQGKYGAAISEKQKALDLSGESAWIAAGLAYAYAVSGKRDRTRKILERLTGPAHQTSAVSYEIATIYAALHDRDHALQWLQRAYDDRSEWVPYMRVEPRLRCLNGDARFQKLTRRFGMVMT